jgi:hypothetical protein
MEPKPGGWKPKGPGAARGFRPDDRKRDDRGPGAGNQSPRDGSREIPAPRASFKADDRKRDDRGPGGWKPKPGDGSREIPAPRAASNPTIANATIAGPAAAGNQSPVAGSRRALARAVASGPDDRTRDDRGPGGGWKPKPGGWKPKGPGAGRGFSPTIANVTIAEAAAGNQNPEAGSRKGGGPKPDGGRMEAAPRGLEAAPPAEARRRRVQEEGRRVIAQSSCFSRSLI